MELSLTGQVAVVTGSTSGIGLAIARALRAAGAQVMLNGLGRAEEIAAARAACGDAPHHPADMRDPAAIRDLIASTEARFGRLDILVNNAGIQHVAPVQEFPEERWDAIIAINLSAAFHATKAALPGMLARRHGRIINIASAHGLVASPFKSAYVAAKHGLVGLTKTVALEVAEQPITCNAICPGFVRTPLAEAQLPPLAAQHGVSEEVALKQYLLAKQPSRRWIEPEEVAALAVYLASPLAAGINGAALSIDGGWLAA
ncbi:MAG: 3-hydroxybutyrate dehydrogenase [Rhodovarius sp.]|nr:3-hydroxybutyrate dehydrogenase [Rhodovarius sp.]MCX7930931.1 3-hydroxybutyrate dehydrogenase [Rhodovarius sp.]MDW8315959.1 3-hydroxybutyrate dehydrogenase [Rhodovarius sp.]